MFLRDNIIAIPTPYYKNTIDLQSLSNIIKWTLSNNFDRVLIIGSTGDQHMLTLEEKISIIDYISNNNKDNKILYGISSVSTEIVLKLVNYLKTKNISAPVMLGIPPYVLMNQQEIINYVDDVLLELHNDVMLYNNIRRTGTNIDSETINILMNNHKNIKAVKEVGSNNIFNIKTDYVYTGFDLKILDEPFYNVTTVIGNIMPKTALYFMRNKKSKNDEEIIKQYREIIDILSNIGMVKSIKYIYYTKGIIQSYETRRPMCEVTNEEIKILDSTMKKIVDIEKYFE